MQQRCYGWRSGSWVGLLAALAACAGSTTTDDTGSSPAATVRQPASAPHAALAAEARDGQAATPAITLDKAPTARSPHHPVFSLIDNRLLAHAQRGGGLVARAGSTGFAKYTQFSKPKPQWRLRAELEGQRVAQPRGKAAIDVPLTSEQAAQPDNNISVRAHGSGSNRVVVYVNGSEAGGKGKGKVELRFGWQTFAVRTSVGQLVPGENEIELRFKSQKVAVDWIQVGGPASFESPQPLYDQDSKALVLPNQVGLAYYVMVPADGALHGRVLGAGCTVSVTATPHAGEPIRGSLHGPRSFVDLSQLAGKVVRLDLQGANCPQARLAEAALHTSGPEPIASEVPAPKYIVLWVMDTLRADRIRLIFPDAQPEIPHMESLAAHGAVFRNAYVQGNESQASHASIWTSVYPVNHDINISRVGGTWKLHRHLAKLGVLMRDAGLYTVGVSANGFITQGAGYGLGFDFYNNPMRDGLGKKVMGKVPSEVVYGRALKPLAAKLDKAPEPFFLFLGTIDTHKPWIARDPWIERYHPEPYKGRYKKIIWGGDVGVKRGQMVSRVPQTPTDLAWINATYNCGISYQDQYVGVLAEQLRKWGILEDTLWVITADHGEEMAEKGIIGHGASLQESLVRVPLIISYPRMFPKGVVIQEGVDTIDILPTLLDLLGREAPDTLQGESLAPIMQGVGRGYPRPAISSMYTYHHGMNLGGWKLIANRRSHKNQLYDLTDDLAETHNLLQERPLERRFTTDALSLFLAYVKIWDKARWGVASNMRPGILADLGE